MSQHHLTVKDTKGNTIKLIAGWDASMLQRFFLVLRDKRIPVLDSEDITWSSDFATMLNFDSDMRSDSMRSIGDVEDLLWKYEIPFVPSDADGSCINPKLLPLLCEILEEKDSPQRQPNKVKFWDKEPDPEPEVEHPDAAEFTRQANYNYMPEDEHPVYTALNWRRYIEEMPDKFIMPYPNWVRELLWHMADREVLLKP